jgi:predicted esterase
LPARSASQELSATLSFLDRFFAASEERRARIDENFKDCGPFRLGQFDPEGEPDFPNLLDMEAAVRKVMARADDFYTPGNNDPEFDLSPGKLTFNSAISNGTVNSLVHVQIVKRRSACKRALIIVPHWNTKQSDYLFLAKILSWYGHAVFILNLPHHGLRTNTTPDHIANEFLNANLGSAIASIRQSVLDVRRLAGWLEDNGYQQIDLVGVSLGSCVAALVAAFEPRLSHCALLMTAGDFAETVWTGRATALIQHASKDHINLKQLRNIWAIISPQHFVDKIASNDTRLMMISCKRDSVVHFKLGMRFAQALTSAGVKLKNHALACGHYTLGSFPFNMMMLFMLLRFLHR